MWQAAISRSQVSRCSSIRTTLDLGVPNVKGLEAKVGCVNRLNSAIIGVCLFLIGWDSARVPGADPVIWPIIYTAMALGVVHMIWRPDKFKLRILTAMMAATGMFRGLMYFLDNPRHFGPIAFHLMVATLTIGYWEVRKKELPEKHDEPTPIVTVWHRSTSASERSSLPDLDELR